MTGEYKHIRLFAFDEFIVRQSTHKGEVLGRVEWNPHWKEYEFLPKAHTGFTVECLNDIANFVGKMNENQEHG